jgi:hypothetical protein
VEDTVIHYLETLPEGKDYHWFEELNIVGLSARIKGDQEAICKALNNLQSEWRRNVLHLVS